MKFHYYSNIARDGKVVWMEVANACMDLDMDSDTVEHISFFSVSNRLRSNPHPTSIVLWIWSVSCLFRDDKNGEKKNHLASFLFLTRDAFIYENESFSALCDSAVNSLCIRRNFLWRMERPSRRTNDRPTECHAVIYYVMWRCFPIKVRWEWYAATDYLPVCVDGIRWPHTHTHHHRFHQNVISWICTMDLYVYGWVKIRPNWRTRFFSSLSSSLSISWNESDIWSRINERCPFFFFFFLLKWAKFTQMCVKISKTHWSIDKFAKMK